MYLFLQFDGPKLCEIDNELRHCVFPVVDGGNSTEAHYKKHREVMKGKGNAASLLLRLTVSKGSHSYPIVFVTEKLVELVVFFFLLKGFSSEVIKAVCGQIRCVWLAHQIRMKMKWNDQFALH